MTQIFSLKASTDYSARQIHESLAERAYWQADECSAAYARRDTGGTARIAWSLGTDETELEFETPLGRAEILGREFSEEWQATATALSCEWKRVDNEDTELLEAWRRQNRDRLEQLEFRQSVDHLARQDLNTAWEWNHRRDDIQSQLDEGLFVPGIVFFADREDPRPREARRAVVWPDAIPIAIPETELLVVSVPDSNRLERPAGPRIIEMDRATEIIRSEDASLIERHEDPAPHWKLSWSTAPYDLIDDLAAAGATAEETNWKGLSKSSVVESDLVG